MTTNTPPNPPTPPTNTLAFLFTDKEGSTQLWERIRIELRRNAFSGG